MKRIDFKFDINDKVTVIDGRKGEIFELRYGGSENYYIVNFEGKYPQDWVLESELLAGHDCFIHERKTG